MNSNVLGACDQRGRMRNVLSALGPVLAVCAMGMGLDLSDQLTALLGVLVATLSLDFACGRLEDSTDGTSLELACLPQDCTATIRSTELCRTLRPWLSRETPTTTSRVPHPCGAGNVSLARCRLGLHDDLGILLAGSSRPDFPTEFEHVLLQVASNQAAIGLMEARQRRDQMRLQEQQHRAAEREEWLRRLADAIPEVVWITALNPERVLYVSSAFERVWGLTAEALYREPRLWIEKIHPEDRARVSETFSRWIAGDDVNDHEVEYRIIQPEGGIRWIHERGVLFRDEQGRPYEASGISTDITERKKAQRELECAFEEIQILKDHLQQENIALQEEVDKTSMFEEIVGTSSALRTVLANIAKVAPTDSTVLITGETGTGKELVARAIHKHSARAGRPFVSVNCAAIPVSLIASELFGHERGAFTGAVARRQGRFELAAGGTLFLDEVGELPTETQLALLRVLQEREFERVGGDRPIRADVRVIAATNWDLQLAVAEKTFRADLFYRLNVFPLEMPALRDRREDIPLLVEYFTHRFANRAGKRITKIAKATLDAFQEYDWPGNIRELQNLIERAVIISNEPTLTVDQRWLPGASGSLAASSSPSSSADTTLLKHERSFIEAVLEATKGRVSGPFGAATRLGMPASTLESKIKALNIDKRRFKPLAPPRNHEALSRGFREAS